MARRYRSFLTVLLSCAVLALGIASSWPQDSLRGVALVIGQSDYETIADLPNAERDADAIETLLGDLGFDASAVSDRDSRRLSRDLDAFLDDADGADVAIVYYAGHAVEVGGENYLVPTDADLASPQALAASLVSLGAYVESLQSKAKVTIVLLDACRDNPFPAGTTVTLPGNAAPVAIASAGLQSRGVVAMTRASTATPDGLGIVVGFAAEPGKVALDGEPGANSPYAAALLRHVSAMAGEEFGTVMRMVAEEVYLKTGGRQRPWINESLRRLLYFGERPTVPDGDEGAILAERRQLLLTIAALPDPQRRQVERVATGASVPMDALYGMLRTLGAEAPQDPIELEKLLRSQTGRLKELLAERAALSGTDAEIVRLSALADKALSEGALATALSLHERAKARVEALGGTVERAEADIRARRIEFAAVFARSAAAYQLNFDHLKAAEDYARAFEQVERWDDGLAWDYKQSQTLSLLDHGVYKADNAALRRALETGEVALRIAGNLDARKGNRRATAATQQAIAFVLSALGSREPGTASLEKAVAAARRAVDAYGRVKEPRDWALAQTNLGKVLWTLGEQVDDPARIEEAVAILEEALKTLPRAENPDDWSAMQNDLGNALHSLGTLRNDPDRLMDAASAYLAGLDGDLRQRDPLDWAMRQYNLGRTYSVLAQMTSGFVSQKDAVDSFKSALGEFERERMPMIWAQAQSSMCVSLGLLGEETGSLLHLENGVAACRASLEVWSRGEMPVQWAAGQNNLAGALAALGRHEKGTRRLEEAVAAYKSVLESWTAETLPLGWAWVQSSMGDALIEIGQRTKSSAPIREGRAALRRARDLYRKLGLRYDDDFAQRIARADAALKGKK